VVEPTPWATRACTTIKLTVVGATTTEGGDGAAVAEAMPPPFSAGEGLQNQTVVGAVGGAVPAPPAAGEGLHYQSVVGSNAVGGEAAAEGFFDLANAALVRYTVKECKQSEHAKGDNGGGGGASGGGGGGSSGAVELLVEQDQSLHNSCGGIVWESAFCLAAGAYTRSL